MGENAKNGMDLPHHSAAGLALAWTFAEFISAVRSERHRHSSRGAEGLSTHHVVTMRDHDQHVLLMTILLSPLHICPPQYR